MFQDGQPRDVGCASFVNTRQRRDCVRAKVRRSLSATRCLCARGARDQQTCTEQWGAAQPGGALRSLAWRGVAWRGEARCTAPCPRTAPAQCVSAVPRGKTFFVRSRRGPFVTLRRCVRSPRVGQVASTPERRAQRAWEARARPGRRRGRMGGRGAGRGRASRRVKEHLSLDARGPQPTASK